ncbi:MAG: hypothetical protein U5L05_00430 [Rubrivivax sp.]|nr:hypothetical protein [Rubrivivax sp.]
MKTIIEVTKRGSTVPTARRQVAAARKGQSPDFHLSFESARSLFSELTPARVVLVLSDSGSDVTHEHLVPPDMHPVRADLPDDEILRRLLVLNRERAALPSA